MTEGAREPVWAGFWRRVIAYLVDALLLGGLGLGIGALFHDVLVALTGPTRLIGLGVCLLYFGVLTSGAGGGASLGMRLLGLRVRSLKGRPIGLLRALWRALVLQAPFTLNGMMLDLDDPLLSRIYMVAAVTLVFGVTLAQVVLLLFNRPSRRLLHDLVSGTGVVRAGAAGPLPKTRSRAPAVAWLIVLAALGAGLWLTWRPIVPAVPRLNELSAVQTAVQALPEVLSAGVTDNTHTVWREGKSTTSRTLVVAARLRARPQSEAAVAAQAARVGETVLKVYDLAPGQTLRVDLTVGYDIGIASFWRTDHRPYPPAPAVPAPVAAPAPVAPAKPA